jgi:hypothetical protein
LITGCELEPEPAAIDFFFVTTFADDSERPVHIRNAPASYATTNGINPYRTRMDSHAADHNSEFSYELKISMSFASIDGEHEKRKTEGRKISVISVNIIDGLSLGKLPVQSERLKESLAMKLCQEEWQPRSIMLTGIAMFFSGSFCFCFCFSCDPSLSCQLEIS